MRYGVSSAAEAEPWQQDQAALITWQHSGTRPWNESKSCWVNEPIAATCENGVLRDCDQGFAPFSEGAS